MLQWDMAAERALAATILVAAILLPPRASAGGEFTHLRPQAVVEDEEGDDYADSQEGRAFISVAATKGKSVKNLANT